MISMLFRTLILFNLLLSLIKLNVVYYIQILYVTQHALVVYKKTSIDIHFTTHVQLLFPLFSTIRNNGINKMAPKKIQKFSILGCILQSCRGDDCCHLPKVYYST